MHRKVLALLLLLMYLAAAEGGLPLTLRSSEQKVVPLVSEKANKVTVKQETEGISSTEASETTLSSKISNCSSDVRREGNDDRHEHQNQSIEVSAGQENYTESGMDTRKEDNPQREQSSPVQVAIDPSGKESNTKQKTNDQEPAADEQLKYQNTPVELLQGLQNDSVHQQEELNKTDGQGKKNVSIAASDTEDRTEQLNQSRILQGLSNKEVHSVLVTTENKTITLKPHIPTTSQPHKYKATSLGDFHEDSPVDLKRQEQKNMQLLKLPLHGGGKLTDSSKNLQLLETARVSEQNRQSSSVVLSKPISPTEEHDSASPHVGAQHSAQISSPEHYVSLSNIKQETNTQEYYDPELYARPQTSEDLVTTSNALDPKPSITTYSGFTPSFPVRTAIPQYAVREEHPDDLAPHHFALPYVLDRAKFIQYQQAARRFPYIVRVPLQSNFNVPYPVLVERKAQSFSLPLKVLVPQPVLSQARDKVLYPATKPFSFRVLHGTSTSSEDVQEQLGQGRSLGDHQHEDS